jgi:Uma2 family endonuclease
MPVAVAQPVDLSSPPRKQWTREELAPIAKAGLLDIEEYELVEGELLRKMGKKRRHNLALGHLMDWLHSIFPKGVIQPEPSIDVSPADTPTNEPQPDAIVLNRPARDIPTLPRPDDILLLVEVSDTSLNFDLTVKAALYARAGIQDYWVIDINARRVIIHRKPRNGGYVSVIAYAEDEMVSPEAAPQAEIKVADLL